MKCLERLMPCLTRHSDAEAPDPILAAGDTIYTVPAGGGGWVELQPGTGTWALR